MFRIPAGRFVLPWKLFRGVKTKYVGRRSRDVFIHLCEWLETFWPLDANILNCLDNSLAHASNFIHSFVILYHVLSVLFFSSFFFLTSGHLLRHDFDRKVE